MSTYNYEVTLSGTGADADAGSPNGIGAITHAGDSVGALSACAWTTNIPESAVFGTAATNADDDSGYRARILFNEPTSVLARTETKVLCGLGPDATITATLTLDAGLSGEEIVVIDTEGRSWTATVSWNASGAVVTDAGFVHRGPTERRKWNLFG